MNCGSSSQYCYCRRPGVIPGADINVGSQRRLTVLMQVFVMSHQCSQWNTGDWRGESLASM